MMVEKTGLTPKDNQEPGKPSLARLICPDNFSRRRL